MGNVFTPRMKVDNKWVRMNMSLDDVDILKIGRGHWTAIVTDLLTGKSYRAKGTACSLPGCYCDAIVTILEDRKGERNGKKF